MIKLHLRELALPNKTALVDAGFYLVGDAAYTFSDVMLVPGYL